MVQFYAIHHHLCRKLTSIGEVNSIDDVNSIDKVNSIDDVNDCSCYVTFLAIVCVNNISYCALITIVFKHYLFSFQQKPNN